MGHLLLRVIRHSIARQEQLQDARNQALTCPLTGIGNRRAFDLELKRRMNDFRRGEMECSVALFDIDRFKTINDEYGHDQGDDVLKGVSHILRDKLRTVDCRQAMAAVECFRHSHGQRGRSVPKRTG